MEIALRHETAEAIRVRPPEAESATAPEPPDLEAHELIEAAQ
jgi:hypothetical protein